MDNLYYKSIGIDDERTEDRIVHRLTEFYEYFDNTERELKRHKPAFSFRLGPVVWKPDESQIAPIESFSSEKLYYDETCQHAVPSASIDRIRKEVYPDTDREPRMLYSKRGTAVQGWAFRRIGYLLTDIIPKGVSEDEQDSRLGLLENADKIEISSEGQRKRIGFKNRMRKDDAILVGEPPSGNEFYLPDNTYVLSRQRRAIELLARSPQRHQLPILNLFRKYPQDFSWADVTECTIKKWYVLKDSDRDGTEEQREFVKKALGTPEFAILEGPPGSGKTTAILELVAQAAVRGMRVLMVASTHVAVDNILERLVETQISSGKKQLPLKDVCGIIPLRIGDDENVSDEVKPFCIQNQAETEIRRLNDRLAPLISTGEASTAQLRWSEALNQKKTRQEIGALLLECSNLVCGTTIGILRAPIIRDARAGDPLFDLVILDEASKTTFAEFLVPALHGKRWILSGDIKQLTPYVDREPILENLRALPTFSRNSVERERALCLAAFQVVKGRSKIPANGTLTSIFLCDTPEEARYYFACLQDHAKAISSNVDGTGIHWHNIVPVCVTSPPKDDSKRLEILGSNFIITVPELSKDLEPYLPPDIQLDREDIERNLGPGFLRRMQFCRIYPDERKTSWEEEVQWRISRMHELKDTEEFETLNEEVALLMPRWTPEGWKGPVSRGEVVLEAVNRIRRIALPSIIELLMEGFETGNRGDRIALYEGLTYDKKFPEILKKRHVLLTYQHRMHPQISRFSRETIYHGEALRDATGMAKIREWGYAKHYSSPAVWIDCHPEKGDLGEGRSRFNLKEVREIRKELEAFFGWARSHPNPGNGGIWTIACLTFYKGQERRVMEELESLSSKRGIYSSFVREQDNALVRISTVDRFQGHEADIVFLSFVQTRRGRRPHLGFLNFQNRINVAVTRPRFQIVIVGQKKNFTDCKVPLLESLAEGCTPGRISLERGLS